MGSVITLSVGNLEVDWAKNRLGCNHAKLFLRSDVRSELYDYVVGGEVVAEERPAYVRDLGSIVQRLELLGYSLESCRELYSDWAISFHRANDFFPAYVVSIIFEEFAAALRSVDLRNSAIQSITNLNDDIADRICQAPSFKNFLPESTQFTRLTGDFFDNLDPYFLLRLLAENPKNLDTPVVWRFADVLEGGWVSESDVHGGLDKSDKWLVVTEGSSDSLILNRSLERLRPDVADFFRFVDMSDGYPFTGSGNVLRFCQGLAKIQILNKVLIVLDNDAAGLESAQKLQELELPENMRVTLLPNLQELESFPTVGPSGLSMESINGRAASIELYLDLDYERDQPPTVKWTSFNSFTKRWQGELVSKGNYMKSYLQRGWNDESYDHSRLWRVWDHLLQVASRGRPRSEILGTSSETLSAVWGKGGGS